MPAGPGLWRAPDLTIRANEAGPGPRGSETSQDEAGASLLISLYGAHHVRFDRVAGAPDMLRGLRG